MQKIITTFLFCFFLTQIFGQTREKVTTSLLIQYIQTIYDRTIGNNPWGVGVGFQTFFNAKSSFAPTVELTGDIYQADDRVLRLNPDGTIPTKYNDVPGMINVFAGSLYHLTQNVYVSFIAGLSFIGGETFLGIKPSLGFIFLKISTGPAGFLILIFLTVTSQKKKISAHVVLGLE